jgi:glycolate oxidase iron-sulfur subunit
VERSPAQQALRWTLRHGLTAKPLFGGALMLGRVAKALLPKGLGANVPSGSPAGPWPAPRHERRMLVLEGCVQPALLPSIDAAMARVLDRIGISLIRAGGGCCGALPHHLDATAEAIAYVKRNIDAWWPQVARGAEAIVVTASGCGVMVRDCNAAPRQGVRGQGRRIADPRATRSRSSPTSGARSPRSSPWTRARCASPSSRRARCSTG